MRGDGRIFQRGNRWWVAYCAPGPTGKPKEVRESAGRTYAEAKKFLRARLDELAVHRTGLRRFQGPAQERVTVGDLLDLVKKDYEARGRKSLPQLTSRIKNLSRFFLSDKAVGVTSLRLQDYIKFRTGEGAAPATINRELEALQTGFNLAKESGQIWDIPVFRHLPEQNARQGFLSTQQVYAILDNIRDSDLRDFLHWFACTGMRPGETGALTWACFDKESMTITLPGRDAKTGRPRTIPIEGDELGGIIKRRQKARLFGCALIFHRKGKPIGDYRKAWKTACAAAGVEGFLPYDVRRTAVRSMVRAGVDPAVAMKISGHRTRATFDRYNITSNDDTRDAMRKTGAYRSEQVQAGAETDESAQPAEAGKDR